MGDSRGAHTDVFPNYSFDSLTNSGGPIGSSRWSQTDNLNKLFSRRRKRPRRVREVMRNELTETRSCRLRLRRKHRLIQLARLGKRPSYVRETSGARFSCCNFLLRVHHQAFQTKDIGSQPSFGLHPLCQSSERCPTSRQMNVIHAPCMSCGAVEVPP